jgi:hypothetical protein
MPVQTDERPVEAPQREERVVHRYCECQKVDGHWVPPITALCGHVKLTPLRYEVAPGADKDDCIVCRGLHAAHIRCRLCRRVMR